MSVAGKAVGDPTPARAFQPVSNVDPATGLPASGTTSPQVQGPVAAGGVNTANPQKMGGAYNTTLPTLTNGTIGDVQLNVNGNLRTLGVGVSISASDGVSGGAIISFISSAEASIASPRLLTTTGYVFSGTTYERQRGDANSTSVQPSLTSAFWVYAAATGGITNTTTPVTVKAAGGAGVRNYLESIQINWDALGAATEIAVRDGSGTVLWRMKIVSGAVGSRDVKFGTALKGPANSLLEVVTLTASVTGSVYVNAQGWTGV